MSDPNADTRIFDFFGVDMQARAIAEHCENIGCDLHEFPVNTDSGEWVVIVKRKPPNQDWRNNGR